MAAHLLKTSRHGKTTVLSDCIRYFFGFAKWRIVLAIIRPLNFMRETTLLLSVRKWFCKFFFREYLFETKKPINLLPEHQNRFVNDYYLLKPLEILPLKNQAVYLTGYHGIVFDNFRITPESIHGKWDRRNVSLLKDYYPLIMEAWLYARHDNNPSNELKDEKKYLLAHHWFNYYHWLTETLLRLWLVRDRLNEHTVLLPASFREIPFVQLSLEALNVQNIAYVPEGIQFVKNLTLVENKPYCNHYYPQLTRAIGKHFSDYVQAKGIRPPVIGDKIFISRKKADRRKLVNEEEVERLLAGFGFTAVTLEDYDFFQQVAILNGATHLIGMHGAGLTNMLFMPQGGKVLELHRELYSRNDLFSDVYWKLASALGHEYYYQFCEAENRQDDFFKANYLGDLKELKKNVEEFVR